MTSGGSRRKLKPAGSMLIVAILLVLVGLLLGAATVGVLLETTVPGPLEVRLLGRRLAEVGADQALVALAAASATAILLVAGGIGLIAAWRRRRTGRAAQRHARLQAQTRLLETRAKQLEEDVRRLEQARDHRDEQP